MATELGALELPIRATGRDATLKALNEVESGALAVTRRIMQQEAQAKANAGAMRQLERTARTTFERISLDVSRATADYRLGLVSLKDYQHALDVAKAEVIGLRGATGALDTKQLASFDKVLNQIANSARSARREGRGLASDFSSVTTVLTQRATTAQSGIRRLTSGLGQMAAMAIGARSAVGSLALGALSSFGASAGTLLLITGGIAAISFVIDQLGASSKKSAERVTDLLDSLKKQADQKDPILKAMQDVNTLLAERDRILASIEKRKTLFGELDQTPLPNLFGLGGIALELQKRRARDQAKLGEVNKALPNAEAEAQEKITAEMDRQIAVMTKSVELRTATASVIRNTLALLPLLDAAAKDETKTLGERNEAAEKANAIRAAFKKLADEESEKRKALIQGMRDEAALLGEMSQARVLTSVEVARLRGVYEQIIATLERKNLTDREQLDLIKAQTAALAELARQTSQSFTTKGSTFGAGGVGRPKTPGLDSMTFGADTDRTSDFFAGGALGGFGKDMKGAADRAADSVNDALEGAGDKISAGIDDMRTRIAEGLTDGLVDGIASGFEKGIAAGSIGEGAKQLTATLLSALGSAAIAFGVGSLGIAKLMLAIKKSLASLNPAAAIPAALAMIAVGGLLKGVAGRMFNSGGSGSVSGGSASTDTTTRITVGRDGQPRAGDSVSVPSTASGRAAMNPPKTPLVYSPTYIGKYDQTAQREVVELLKNAASRGWKV